MTLLKLGYEKLLKRLSDMSMTQLIEQYQEQLNNVKRQIKDMEKNGITGKKYKQLKQMKTELQTNIRQMKSYVKKG